MATLVPLLVPSGVAIALATAIGTAVAVRRRPSTALFGCLAGIVPALLAGLVLEAPFGAWWPAPLLVVGLVLQVGAVVAIAALPGRAPRGDLAVAAVACAFCVVTLGAALRQRHAWAPDACADAVALGPAPPFAQDGLTVDSHYEGPQRADAWGPFTCFADIALAGGATRKQTLRGTPTQLSGSITCRPVDVLWCPQAPLLIVDDVGYRGNDLAPAPTRFAGNLSALGLPSGYVALAIAAACAALVALAKARRGSSAASFAATVVAVAGAAPLATALALG
jgi:hypothetical protein